MTLTALTALVCVMLCVQNGVDALVFVQTASGATLNGTLTLTGVADTTTFFYIVDVDTPFRVAGRGSNEEFMALFESGATFSEDPPNGALECEVDGVATTTVVTITAPVLMTDERGVMSLTYDAELGSRIRGVPTIANVMSQRIGLTDIAPPLPGDEVLVCDEGSGVSLYIDNVGGCPYPMSSDAPFLIGEPGGTQFCYAGFAGTTPTCASGFTLVWYAGVPYCA